MVDPTEKSTVGVTGVGRVAHGEREREGSPYDPIVSGECARISISLHPPIKQTPLRS